jgi:aryl-alcohol dehydrogenase-like predicted oxidoreductase
VLVYGPLAHGLLTGTLDAETEFADDDWRRTSDVFEGDAYRRNLEVVRRLGNLAAEHDLHVSQLAIAWAIANPAVHVAIVGTRNPDHIAEAVRAAEVRLTDDDLAAIERIMGNAVKVSGPAPEKMPR